MASTDRLIRKNSGLCLAAAVRYVAAARVVGVDLDELVQAGLIGLWGAAKKHPEEKGFGCYAAMGVQWAILREIKFRARQRRLEVELPPDFAPAAPGGATAGLGGFQRVALEELAGLPGREREVLARRFGIGRESEGLGTIGKHLALSKERVRQIEADALETLRARLGWLPAPAALAAARKVALEGWQSSPEIQRMWPRLDAFVDWAVPQLAARRLGAKKWPEAVRNLQAQFCADHPGG
jgi:RNA polymerase sigma factor (sigma-70 family)